MTPYEAISPYVIFFIMFVAAGLGAPIPEEVAIVAAGLWTAGAPEFGPFRWLMLPVCIVGVIIADVLLYSIGRIYGTKLLQMKWVSKFIPPEKREKIERNFEHYGVGILLFGRLLPGIRTPLFLTAGMMKLSITRFFIADGLGAVLGNSLLFFLAFWFGESFQELIKNAENQVHRAKPVIIIAIILAVAAYFLVHWLRRPIPEGDPEDLPIIGHTVGDKLHEVHESKSISIKQPAPEEKAQPDQAEQPESEKSDLGS